MTPEQIEKAKTIGTMWENGGKRRIYFSNLLQLLGYQLDFYGSGNIQSATLDGIQVSNSSAKKISDKLWQAKFFYDLNDGKFHLQTASSIGREEILAKLERIIIEKCN